MSYIISPDLFHRVFPNVEPQPAMFSWVAINKNHSVDDETELKNIPYVDGDDHDDTFIEEFVKNYDGQYYAEITKQS